MNFIKRLVRRLTKNKYSTIANDMVIAINTLFNKDRRLVLRIIRETIISKP